MEKTGKDFLGNEIKAGDEVVYMQVRYRNLNKGFIVKVTEKMVVISHERMNIGGTETKQFQSQVVKINEK